MARLGDICTVNMGQSPDSATYNEVGRGLPFFQGNADFGRLHPAVRVWCSEPTKIAHTGDILISVRAPIGAMNVADQDCCIGRGLAAIQVNENICDPKYLWYAIQSKVSDLNAKGTGSTFKAISKSTLTDTEVLLVPLDAQKNIARILSNVENSILFRKEQLTKLDELIKARFVEMFGDPDQNPKGWPLVSITEIIRDKASNGFFAKRDAYKDDGNVQILGVSNVVNRMYSNTKELPRTDATQAEKEKYSVKYGDMLFCRSSLVADGIGKASIVAKGTFPNVLFECHVIRLSLDLQKCVPEFVQVLSTTPFFRRQIIAQSKTATMTTIGQDGILKSSVVLPPIDLQNQFADFVAEVDKSKVEVQKALDQTQLLFDSLMQQYFG